MAQSNRNSRLDKRSFSQLANDIAHEPDEYDYFKQNEAFADNYVEDYVNNLLESELIPDILMEVMTEMTDKSKVNPHVNAPLQSDDFIRNTSGNNKKYFNEMRYDGSELLSDNILHNLQMTNKYPVNEKANYKRHYNTGSIDNYYQPNIDLFNTELKSEPYNNRLSHFHNSKSVQPKTNSANYFRFDSPIDTSLSLKKTINYQTTSQLIKAELHQYNNNISSTQDALTEEFIGSTLKSDILRKLVNETIDEERNKQTRKNLMLNPDIDYELENVRNLVSRKPKTKLPKIEKETTFLNIDIEKELESTFAQKKNNDSQFENTFGLFSSQTNASLKTNDLFNMEFLDNLK